MKKNSFAFLLTLAMMLSVTGCGSQTKEVVQTEEQIPKQQLEQKEELPPKDEVEKKESIEIGKVIAIENNTVTVVLENRKAHIRNEGGKMQMEEGETTPPPMQEKAENNTTELESEQQKERNPPDLEEKTITVEDTTVLKIQTEDGQMQDAVISDITEGAMIGMEYDEQNQLQTIMIMREIQTSNAEVIGK